MSLRRERKTAAFSRAVNLLQDDEISAYASYTSLMVPRTASGASKVADKEMEIRERAQLVDVERLESIAEAPHCR